MICCDEAGPAYVVRHKKELFQSGAHAVSLEVSATNLYSYIMCVNRVQQAVTCNQWNRELADLEEPDETWLKQNGIYGAVEAKLWVD